VSTSAEPAGRGSALTARATVPPATRDVGSRRRLCKGARSISSSGRSDDRLQSSAPVAAVLKYLLKLFEKAEPGESIQVDVKYVQIAGRWAFQHTDPDDCTCFRVLRIYRCSHHGSSLAFLADLQRAFLFPITDTFGPDARNRTVKPSAAVGSIRRSSGDGNAFWISMWRRQPFGTGEIRYNYERFSLALQGRPPAEKLPALQPPRRAA
jgi:hypothetical protein